MNSAAPWPPSGLKALLGQPTPAFIVAPALTVTKDNVVAGLEGVAQPRCAAVGARRRQVGPLAGGGPQKLAAGYSTRSHEGGLS